MKPDTTSYAGYRDDGGKPWVLVDGDDLTPDRSLGVRDHSPTGFEWGYAGSGPSQLALAILLDFTGDVDLARHFYQGFKFARVAKWRGTWSITGREIREWMKAYEAAHPFPREMPDEMEV